MDQSSRLLLLVLLYLLARQCSTVTGTVESDFHLHLSSRSTDRVSGVFAKSTGSDRGVQFELEDGSDSMLLHLRSWPSGSNLLLVSANFTEQGGIHHQPNEYRIMGDNLAAAVSSDPLSLSGNPAESALLGQLRRTAEYQLLPLLAVQLGSRYNISGRHMRSAFAFYTVAMDAHGQAQTHLKSASEAHGDQLQRNAVHRRHKRSSSARTGGGVFKCPSTSGRCSTALLKYRRKNDCNGNGLPIKRSMFKGNCLGLCGPSCKCWVWVCGDCCSHPGCKQHDIQCRTQQWVDCYTLKGVVWGRKSAVC